MSTTEPSHAPGHDDSAAPDGIRQTLLFLWDVIRSLASLFHERPAQIIGSTFLLLMLWGYHGGLDMLSRFFPETWFGPGKGWPDAMRLVRPDTRPRIFDGVPWDQELISFLAGVLLLVVVPALIIRFGFRERLADFGLALPRPGRRKIAWLGFAGLMLLSIPAFYVASFDSFPGNGMQQFYPYFRPFTGAGEFLLYEISYFPFFVAVEFIFRGYLLFGLAHAPDPVGAAAGKGVAGRLFFGHYALLVQMLSYTAWHLGKPIPELWGTVVWGLIAGTVVYRCGSIWPAVFAHYLLNVFLDYMILHRLGIWVS